MRCFTFFHKELTPGIQTTLSKKSRRLVFLGCKGDYCKCGIVFLDRGKDEDGLSTEPEVNEEGMIQLAYPAKRKFHYKIAEGVEQRERVVLKRAFKSPTKILLRVNTSTLSKHKINGRWQARGGWPQEWVKAHGFSNGQRWHDDLIVMDDQDVILIVPAGGGRSDRMIVRNDRGEISCLPELDYLRILHEHQKEIAEGIARQESVEETGDTKIPEEETVTSPQEVEEAVETGDDYSLETEKLTKLEENEATSQNDEVEKGKAPLDQSDTIIHAQEGQTIGA
jgi:hypothetical protein